MCYNLRNKQYHIRNVEYSKEEYFNQLKKIRLDSYKNIQALKSEFEKILKEKVVHRENFNLKTTNSVGNYMTNCDKCVNVFTWDDSQNCRSSLRGLYSKDCIDQIGTWHVENSGDNACVYGGYPNKHTPRSHGRYF